MYNSIFLKAVFLHFCSNTKSLLSPASTLAAMTDLEKCMESLIFTFHRYAEAGGDGNTLSKKELKKILENELPTFLKVNIIIILFLKSICLSVWKQMLIF